MGKEKRKTRLNKGEGGEFIGFGAFASPGNATASQNSDNTTVSKSGTTGGNGLVLAPVYMGSDSTLQILFSRIGQKRDSTTKAKALAELQTYLSDPQQVKKSQVEGLAHFLYLYATKLHYDNTPKVRSTALDCCTQAIKRLPKAWNTLTITDTINATTKQQSLITGMIHCARADPATEVRLAAQQACQAMKDTFQQSDTRKSPSPFLSIWDYVQKMVSYLKPLQMHQDLFQKASSNSTDKQSTKLSEKQEEELDERYERIVGTALGGLELYLRELPSQKAIETPQDLGFPNTTTPETLEDSKKGLRKHLASPKASLRRKTYLLISVACQRAPFLLDIDKLSKLLGQNLAAEKELTNVKILLETLLAFIAMFPDQEKRSSVLAGYVKPLTKLFGKGGHGATQWGPTVLPIVALLPTAESQASLLTSIWSGKSHIVGTADQLQIIAAVAETASFLLLRRRQSTSANDDVAFSEVIGQCWLQALQSYLTYSTASKGPTLVAHQRLGQSLANDLTKLDQETQQSPQSQEQMSAIRVLEDWFWKDKLPQILLDPSLQPLHISSLLQFLSSQSPTSSGTTTPTTNHLATIWKGLFHQGLDECRGQSGMVPTIAMYELWTALLEHLSLSDIFEDDASLESFLMNDLLRWMVIHTSTISNQKDMVLANYDFQLLRRALLLVSDSKASWDAILRELVSAKADWDLLGSGLAVLVGSDRLEETKSTILNDLVHTVAKEALESPFEDASHGEGDMDLEDWSGASDFHHTFQTKASRILQICLGLGTIHDALVDGADMAGLVALACPKDPKAPIHENAVLETLFLLVQNSKISDMSLIEQVLLQTWRQGGNLWESKALCWLDAEAEFSETVLRLAKKELVSTMRQGASESKIDTGFVHTWARRAVRLLDFCREHADPSVVELPSLTLIGLAEKSVWLNKSKNSQLGFAAQAFVAIMELIESSRLRWELFHNSVFTAGNDSTPDNLLMEVLWSLSGASPQLIHSHKTRIQKDPANLLLDELTATANENPELKTRWIKTCTNRLGAALVEPTEDPSLKIITRGVAILSRLVSLQLSGIRPSASTSSRDRLEPNDVREGDALWYISNPEQPEGRERCTIVKVHRDLPTEVYFTIRLQRDTGTQERQTVCDRLRSEDFSRNQTEAQSTTVSIESLSKEDKAEREALVQVIVKDAVTPSWASWTGVEYELLHIIISQVGIIGPRGIGSTHYTIFQKLQAIQTDLVSELDKEGEWTEEATKNLWKLAYGLGYGLNTPPSSWDTSLIGFDPIASVDSLIARLYDTTDEEVEPPSEGALRASLAWITVSVLALQDPSRLQKLKSLLYMLVSQLLNKANATQRGFQDDDYLSLRAIDALRNEKGEGEDTESDALEALVKSFAWRWQTEATDYDGGPSWTDLPLCKSVLADKIRHRNRLMGYAARKNANHLATALYVPSKRLFALRLLCSYATAEVPIHANPSNAMNDLTSDKLDEWCEGLLDEEAGELEEDVEIVCQWVPQPLLNEMESWHELVNEDPSLVDKDAYDRFSCWLAFLQIVDVAAKKDSLNRGAMTSYATKCSAIPAILNQAIPFANVGTSRKVALDDAIPLDKLLSSGENVALSKLAALVIYRTVEVFPTLSKHWWEMSCPNYFRDAVRDFVESTVSPEILKRELERIKIATSFGEMTVKGSAMSREITALYTQDDFTLSVVIKIPLSFPFRRAEVDCSKTLGIPEKRWKRWSLQITQMLNNQGGTLQDALMLWKENVDKEFEGVEPCPVCYSVLHVKTHKLPDMECKTCHNRFHFDCLTQWFRSSGKSACVMCQQPWAGTRVQ